MKPFGRWEIGAAVFGLLFILLLWHFKARAEAVYRADLKDIVVTLYKEKCSGLPVENLKHRAVWREGGKNTEGCWGASPIGVILFYFADKTVAAIPMRAFEPVTES